MPSREEEIRVHLDARPLDPAALAEDARYLLEQVETLRSELTTERDMKTRVLAKLKVSSQTMAESPIGPQFTAGMKVGYMAAAVLVEKGVDKE